MSRASSKLARVGLVIEAEILALGEGLCIASRLGLINLMVERHLVLVIAWVSYGNCSPWKLDL